MPALGCTKPLPATPCRANFKIFLVWVSQFGPQPRIVSTRKKQLSVYMPANVSNIDSIFSAAAEISTPQERAAFVQSHCGGDEELKRRIEKLLAAHLQAGSFLEAPPAQFQRTADAAIQEGPGSVIGPYKLLEQIGEGGMGIVFMAEQMQPIQRRVALKIIKPGMDTRQVIARFEAERQALALMDHPEYRPRARCGNDGRQRVVSGQWSVVSRTRVVGGQWPVVSQRRRAPPT